MNKLSKPITINGQKISWVWWIPNTPSINGDEMVCLYVSSNNMSSRFEYIALNYLHTSSYDGLIKRRAIKTNIEIKQKDFSRIMLFFKNNTYELLKVFNKHKKLSSQEIVDKIKLLIKLEGRDHVGTRRAY